MTRGWRQVVLEPLARRRGRLAAWTQYGDLVVDLVKKRLLATRVAEVGR